MIIITEELLDKLGRYFTNDGMRNIRPELKLMTFDQFVQKELRRLESINRNHKLEFIS